MDESTRPLINALNRAFWDGAAAGELRLPHCVDSARPFWPPSPTSPFTSGGVDWRRVARTGLVRSIVVYRRPFQQAFAHLLPYGIALIELDGAVRLLAHVSHPDAPDAPRVGDVVCLGLEPLIAQSPPVLAVISPCTSPNGD